MSVFNAYPALATSSFLGVGYPALATSSFLGVGYPSLATSTFALLSVFNAYPALATSSFLGVGYPALATSTFLAKAGGTMTGGLTMTDASTTNFGVNGAKVTGERYWKVTLTSSTIVSISATTTASTTIQIPIDLRAMTVSNINCYTDTGTSSIRIGDGTNYSETVLCGSSIIGADDGSIVNGSFTAQEKPQIQIVNSTVGNPNQTAISIRYTYD